MMLDIKNYKGEVLEKTVKYRLTSHGGRSYDLYNRTRGTVITISGADYASIVNSAEPFKACVLVEREFFKNGGKSR